MSPETTVSLSLIISVISAMGVIFTMAMNLKKDHREDEDRRIDNATEFAKLNIKLDTACNIINDVSKKTDNTNEEIKDISISVAKCNERVETLFKYHDEHEKRINDLEVKYGNSRNEC